MVMNVDMEDSIVNFRWNKVRKTLLYFTEQLLTINFVEKILDFSR